MTQKLYDTDAYLKEFEARVIFCKKTDSGYDAVLDKTAFFPQEGGQNCDTGVIANANVLQVRLDGDTVIHTLDKEVSGDVFCKIDWDKRFDKMQQHTGEHIVSGIVNRLYGYNNVGFHLGDDDVTFDFDGALSRAQLNEIELLANKVVYDNVNIKGYYPERLEKLNYRSKSDIDGNIRIVEIEGVDMCACCAPHVKKTGEVGIIKLLEAQAYKGGVRIHMACGKRAVLDYQTKFENLAVISTALSSGKNNAAEFFEKYVCDTNALKQTLSQYKKEIISLKARLVQNEKSLVIFEDGLSAAMLRDYVNALLGKYDSVCFVLSGSDDGGYFFVGASEQVPMRDILKSMQQSISIRGGGSDKMIQGTINATKEQIKQTIKDLGL